ncbi:MAG TPA: FmdB family transcriptional regulator [Phycisphaerales bacterium]|nr:FmdB family transcriptional regulator [Phycisphaerales bacterium]HCD30759.1 FmdB family transcriptional regulator [Phycisphaerales bacterium]|tara:strand:- start:1246 stop:1551 length:306 start_codon:yes stop_codon:yes gene_type:complete
MPVYVYEVIHDDGEEGQIFEVMQRMSEEPLTQHPTTGQPVRRIIQPPNIATKYTSSHEKKTLSNENLAAKGFTKYEKAGNGEYVKTAGEGPKMINADGQAL